VTVAAVRKIREVETLPESEEVERAVLASIMLAPENLDALSLRMELFHREKHRLIFAAIAELRAEGMPLDARTIQAKLEAEHTLDDAGGVAYLYALDNDLPDIGAAAQYVQILEELRLRRELIDLCGRLVRAALSGSSKAEDLIAEHQGRLISLVAESEIATGPQSLGEVAIQTAAEYSTLSPGEVRGASTGFPELDHRLGGFEPGRLIVIAGRPGMGKSSIAQQIAEHQETHGHRSLIFSLEMSAEEYATRSLVRRTGIEIHRMRDGYTSSAQRERMKDAAREIARTADVALDDRATLRLGQLAMAARAKVTTGGLRVLWVDHLGLLRADGRHEKENTAIAENTRGLKALAKSLGITVVALHQLNRDCEKRPDKRPMLSDLRDSGAVEQDADAVIFVYRDHVYHPETPAEDAELIVAKNRGGATGIVETWWNGETMSFRSREHRRDAH